MENGSVECWEVADYDRPSCVEDKVVYESEEEKSKLGWIIDTGLRLGKKIVIAGIVISSAPVVLPPLVVISGLGCVFSLPFGVVFASYACSQKLMSKLLPSPPLQLEYYHGRMEEGEGGVGIEEEEREEREDVENGIEARIELVDYDEGLDRGDGFQVGYLEEEQREAMEDGIEARIELVDSNERFDNGDGFEVGSLEGKEQSEAMDGIEARTGLVDSNESLDSRDGIEVGYLEEREQRDAMEEGIEARFESEKEQREPMENRIEARTELVNYGQSLDSRDGVEVGYVDEKEEREAVENEIEARMELVDYDQSLDSRDEVEVGYVEEKDDKFLNSVEVGELNKEEARKQDDEKNEMPRFNATRKDDYGVDGESQGQNNVGSSEKDVTLQVQTYILMENEGEKNVPDRTGKDDLLQDQNEEMVRTTVATVKGTEKDGKHRTGKRGKRKTKFQRERKESEEDKRHDKLSGQDRGVMILEGTEASSENKSSLEEKPCPEVVVQEATIVELGSENLDMKQVSVKSNLNDEVGNIEIPLEKEYKPVGMKETSDVSFETDGETIIYTSTKSVVAIDIAEGDSGTIANAAASELQGAYYEEEEKIWEKMDAIRVIIGLKAPRSASYFEELKAMYLFTGIKPPSDSSIDSSSHLAVDFHSKLSFLMSVIGLK